MIEPRKLEIVRLVDHPEHADTVIRWIYEEWGRDQKETREGIRSLLLEKPSWPATLIAISADQVLGLLGFKRYRPPLVDGENHGDDLARIEDADEASLVLWINLLYVHEDRRGEGIGTALLDRSVQLTREVGGEGRLYVYTEVARFYEKLGWIPVRQNLEGGFDVFCLDL